MFSELLDLQSLDLLVDAGRAVIEHCAELIIIMSKNEIEPIEWANQIAYNIQQIQNIVRHILDSLLNLADSGVKEILVRFVDCLIIAIHNIEAKKMKMVLRKFSFKQAGEPCKLITYFMEWLLCNYGDICIEEITFMIIEGIYKYGDCGNDINSPHLGTAVNLVELLEISIRARPSLVPADLRDRCQDPKLHRIVQLAISRFLLHKFVIG